MRLQDYNDVIMGNKDWYCSLSTSLVKDAYILKGFCFQVANKMIEKGHVKEKLLKDINGSLGLENPNQVYDSLLIGLTDSLTKLCMNATSLIQQAFSDICQKNTMPLATVSSRSSHVSFASYLFIALMVFYSIKFCYQTFIRRNR